MSCVFTNDGGITVSLIEHPFSPTFASRNNHEVLFRRMHTYLMDTGIIKNNIIDLGAWIGDNALPWSKSLHIPPSAEFDTGALVYAIDPSPDNCQFIRDLASLNNIKNIRVIQKAISDKREVLSTNEDLTHCSFVSDDDSLTKQNQVKAWPLDDLYNAGEIADVAYIHLDVEGMENRVVAGAEKLINTYKPIIAFEQHLEQDPFIELSEHIAAKGYIVYLINEVLPGCRPDCRNFIAFPKTRFDSKIVEALNAHLGQDVLERVLL